MAFFPRVPCPRVPVTCSRPTLFPRVRQIPLLPRPARPPPRRLANATFAVRWKVCCSPVNVLCRPLPLAHCHCHLKWSTHVSWPRLVPLLVLGNSRVTRTVYKLHALRGSARGESPCHRGECRGGLAPLCKSCTTQFLVILHALCERPKPRQAPVFM